MRFSIIIPTLNEEKFIGGILSDLVQQNSRDFEVIHVDGKSEDQTCQIVETYKKDFPIKTVLSDRRNLSHQRNLGASHASGDYLIFVDADSRIPQLTFLTKLGKESQESKYLIYFPTVRIAQDDPGLKVAFVLYNKAIEVSQLFTSPLPTQGLAIIERSFFHHLGAYHISEKHDAKKLFAEDQELLKRARKGGVIGKAIPHVYYIMSLRRYEREGWLGVLPKLLMSAIEQSVGKSFIESHYEMGGHLYKDESDSSK